MVEITTGRIISSGWQRCGDIEDEEEAQALCDLIEDAAGGKVRYSWARARYTAGEVSAGDIAVEAYVTAYQDDTGATRWATYYCDPEGEEYLDFPTRADAEAAYEENVRGMQSCTADGLDEDGLPDSWWDHTDVPGLDAPRS